MFQDLLGDGLFDNGNLIGIRIEFSSLGGYAFYGSLKEWLGQLFRFDRI